MPRKLYMEDLVAWRETFISQYGKDNLYPKEIARFIQEGRVHLKQDGTPKRKPFTGRKSTPQDEEWF